MHISTAQYFLFEYKTYVAPMLKKANYLSSHLLLVTNCIFRFTIIIRSDQISTKSNLSLFYGQARAYLCTLPLKDTAFIDCFEIRIIFGILIDVQFNLNAKL